MNIKFIKFILILTIILILFKQCNLYLYFSQELSEWVDNSNNCHILFTRYKEPDISQLLKPLINKPNIKIFIYNKGEDIPSGIPTYATNINIISIPNLGWDAYAYFYHVITNYNNLPDYIYSLHASAQYLPWKFDVLKNILNSSNINLDTKYYYGGIISTCDSNFILDEWDSTYILNRSINNYSKSNVRPLSNWIKSKISILPSHIIINNTNDIKINYFGMFKVHKSRILKYPMYFYEDIFHEISVWQSEVNHYLERSWYAFYGE